MNIIDSRAFHSRFFNKYFCASKSRCAVTRMAAPSDSDDAFLISSEEIKLSVGAEDTEGDSLFSTNPYARETNQRHSNTEEEQLNNPPGRFVALSLWGKVLLKWWRTLVIILTPLILLLLFAVAEDTRVRFDVDTFIIW